MTNRRWMALAVLAVVTLGICLLLVTDWLPALRGPVWLDGEWTWPHLLRPIERWWLPILSAVIMLAVGAWWLGRAGKGRSYSGIGLLALVAANLLLQFGLVYADRPQVAAELVDRNLAVQTSGYFRAAAEIDDIGRLLSEYPEAMVRFESEHLRTHPPGLIIGNWLLIQALEGTPSLARAAADLVRPLRCADLWVLESPDDVVAGLGISAFLALLAAALAIPLAFLCAKEITGEYGRRIAAVLAAALPALILFAPLADQILAFLGLLAILLLLVGQRRQSVLLHFASGVVLALASFMSLGTLALAVAPAMVLGVRCWLAPRDRRAVAKWAGAFVLGLASLWLLYWLVWGVAPWDIAQTAMNQHYQLVTSQRAYGVWLGFNVVDLILFAGTAVVFGFAGASVMALKAVKQRQPEMGSSLTLGVALLIGTLLFSGSTRGEVGRIWLFFMPLMAVSAGCFLASWLPDRRGAVLLVGLQLALVVTLGLAWRPVEAVIVRAERPEMVQMPAEATEIDIEFDQGIILSGYSLAGETYRPGEHLPVTLAWQGEDQVTRPFTVFIHVVDESGALAAQYDSWPVQGQWPTTCWQNGETVVDAADPTLPADMAAGEYSILVGLYDASTAQRLQLLDSSDAYELARIRVIGDE